MRLCCVPAQTISQVRGAKRNEMYFSEHENHSQMDHNILLCGKKKQMSTIALKDNDHHLATEIFVHMTSPHPHCPFDILSAISSHYYSFPFLPSPLFTSIPLPSLLPLYPGGRDQQHSVRLPSIYSFRLSMLCIHNLAEASHHTHHASNVAS